LVNPRNNPRGAYYENLIVSKPLKIQGVGPGGTNPSSGLTTRGSIIDAGAFAGDSVVATDWYTTLNALPTAADQTQWDGNQNVFDGAGITVFARAGTFKAASDAGYAASIDGLDLRGGNQQGFPGNLNAIGGGATGLPANLTTQGGAIFANAYATDLRVSNNTVQNNGGGYGTIRFGTPDLPAPNTSNHNERVRITNNRIIQNAGTNLAGGIGLFAGSDNYEVANNDICGNFSAEYGGGLSVFGYSPAGKIHDNRIYFNASYDEGGGIMVGGALPSDPTALSQGSGPVDIYNNQVQANLSNDDGGGIRFLMAGNYPINVYNNIVVNNVSTHEGGGIALNDAPNVRVFNNTIMKNITTATAVTSNGTPAPAGLSTSLNTAALQASLPGGSPSFSNPVLFNNIFWDNRAGSRAGGSVTGIGATGDAGPIVHWDLGEADSGGALLLSPTNSVLQVADGTVASPTNILTDPGVIAPYDVGMSFQVWRNNPAFVGAVMATVDLPPNQMGNYHLPATPVSPAQDTGAASKTIAAVTYPAPAFDIDNESRPGSTGFDIGADELVKSADLSISKTDGKTTILQGSADTYTVVATNLSPGTVTGATVADTMPAGFTGATWNCAASAGSTCNVASGSGNINTTVVLAAGGTATFTVTGTVTGTLSVANTATVTPPAGTADPILANNSATDTTSITAPAGPTWASLDNFNRGNANTLGGNWSQNTLFGLAAIRLNANQANAALLSGQAIWNGPGSTFGATQGAQFTFANTTLNNATLFLKAAGGNAANPTSFIQVQYQTAVTTGPAAGRHPAQVVVSTTLTAGITSTTRGTLTTGAAFANGNKLGVIVTPGVGTAPTVVTVYKTVGTTTTAIGTASIPITGAGSFAQAALTGRIGFQLPSGGRVDDFAGGTQP
ncbi:MAG: DUF11 domain-containing protein, partial [Ilumatobacteraceae bacterium]